MKKRDHMIKFKFIRADDETSDPEYRLFVGDHESAIAIQDCRSYGGSFTVTVSSDFSVVFLGDHRTRQAAKDAAIALYMAH